ncbi:serine/threonine-protein kinase [Allokutzneria sp. NRRL B-24872]|uniref:serine/threonine-protein kinase n=1 Tax=Allokutzneria sp. NRRL B-24872 TaxID=1137961 RepID=UPI000A3ABC4A|nr:serine/threonine-protein kinase [Allokutzneria sp. NRRL B-24872]
MRSGTLIAGRYRLEEPIGAGGMGMVWLATDELDDRHVALKQATGDDRSRALLRREATVVARLRHPNIVEFFGEVQDGDEWWLVMEYVPSSSLAARVHADGAMPPQRVARIGAQLADALAAVHADKVLHRDVKPSNVLVDATDAAKLTDFGIARVLGTEATRTHTGLVGGTPAFLSPEVANGEEPTTASDVFSLGATLFAAVEGTAPFGETENPLALLRRVANAPIPVATKAGPLAPVLTELMRRAPQDRPSAATARRLLLEVAEGGDSRPRAFKRGAAVTGAVLALVAATIIWWPEKPALGVGDPRTADPCALFDLDAIGAFGTTELDAAYSGLARCDVIVQGAGDSVVDLQAEFRTYSSAPEGPTEKLGPVSVIRGSSRSDLCQRIVLLPDGNGVRVTADHAAGAQVPRLCELADSVTLRVAAMAAEAQLPRRNAQFPAESLARRDACELVPAEALASVPGVAKSSGRPGFGNWSCNWPNPGTGQGVDLYFDRGNASFNERRDGRRGSVGGRETYTKPTGAGDEAVCSVSIVHRTYPDAGGGTKSELVVVKLGGQSATAEGHCAVATALITALAPRL